MAAAVIKNLGQGVFYSLSEGESQYVNLILNAGKSVTISVDALQWFAPTMVIQCQRTLFEATFGRSSNLITLQNDGSVPAAAALSKLIGASFVISFEARHEISFWVFRSPFLLGEASVRVQPKPLPVLRSAPVAIGYFSIVNDVYHCSGKKGSVIIQGGNDVLKRELQREEVFCINSTAILAIETSCTIETVPLAPMYLPFTFTDIHSFLKIKGPGVVYYSPQSRSILHSEQRLSGAIRRNLAPAFVLSMLMLLVTVVILTRLTENLENLLFDEDLLNRLQNQVAPQ